MSKKFQFFNEDKYLNVEVTDEKVFIEGKQELFEKNAPKATKEVLEYIKNYHTEAIDYLKEQIIENDKREGVAKLPFGYGEEDKLEIYIKPQDDDFNIGSGITNSYFDMSNTYNNVAEELKKRFSEE